MSGENKKYQNRALIQALAAGKTVRECAEQLGISESTIYRRLRSRKFRQLLMEAQGEITERVIAQVVNHGTKALNRLTDLMDNGHPDVVKLGAAKAILDVTIRWRDYHRDVRSILDDLKEIKKRFKIEDKENEDQSPPAPPDQPDDDGSETPA